MATVVKMPKWGLTMTAGTVTDWLYEEGAEISEGVPLLTVETEKAVNDVEAPADGVLLRIVADKGSEIPVSAPVAIIVSAGEELSEEEIAALIESASPKKAGGSAKGGDSGRSSRERTAAARDESGRVNASPAARRLAQELGVDLAAVEATGPGGRITSDDVQRAADAANEDPSPREERITLWDGRELAALVAGPGSAPAIVFIHGLGGSQSTWQVVLGELVELYRLVAIDLPGHGASDKGPEADYSVDGLAGVVAEAVAKLRLNMPIVVGHSLGGAVAMTMALTTPASVRGLILINSAGLSELISPKLTELMSGEPGPDTGRGLLSLFYADQRLVVDRAVHEMAGTQTAEGAWAAQQAVANAAFTADRQLLTVRNRLTELSVPVLLIWGEQDQVIASDDAISAMRAIPDATLRLLPDSGHVPQVEQASETAIAIDRFAKSLS